MPSPLFRHRQSRRVALSVAVALIAAFLTVVVGTAPRAAAAACDPGGSVIVCENSKTGTPLRDWDVTGAGDDTLQGFATDMSVNAGQRVDFKIKTSASSYTIDIYRVGWYNGDGARKVDSVTPSARLPQSQPACLSDPTTGLVDCGNWGVSASWNVPSTAVSGVYFALLSRGIGGDSQIWFVVRNDASHSDVLVQTSDSTWQAYNRYGGNSLYVGGTAMGRAYKVSYNRPFTNADYEGQNWVLNAEIEMIWFLERNGYDVSYTTDVDSDRRGALIKNHKVFVSSGHDEYWSGNQRTNVEAALAAGTNLAFFSGNEVYWKTRWETSIDGSGTAHRTLVCYKETRDNAKTDPSSQWTGTWRDVRFSPPSDGGRPENALTGTYWKVQQGSYPLKVPAADGKMRFWRGTTVATQASNGVATLATNSLGYEWDEDLDNGSRPPGLVRLSSQTETNIPALVKDAYGNDVGEGTATHHMVMYRAPSGALVFGSGTVSWAYGLAEYSDHTEDQRMQQATVNLLADMGVQPASLMPSLSQATKSTDTTGPTVTVTSPASNQTFGNNDTITVTGTATDTGGGVVGAVEVSLDGGATWHPATGRASWSYTGAIQGEGATSIKVRASDDSANLGAVTTVTATVNCPCTVYSSADAPTTPAASDTSAVELGVRFRSTKAGYVTGVRFWKPTANTGTHTGSLWSNTGQRLATVTFTGETTSGWQTADFDDPIQIAANTTYVVSYYSPNGRYVAEPYTYQNAGSTTAPLAALRDGVDGASGAFKVGSGFPDGAFQASDYWVDPVFRVSIPPDTTPPVLASTLPASGATGVDGMTTVVASFNENLLSGSGAMTVKLPDGTLVPGTVTTTGRTVSFVPDKALRPSTTYVARVTSATDKAGNVQTTAYQWTFTTAAAATCPCTVFPASMVPANPASGDSSGVELGVKVRADIDGWISGIRFYKGAGNGGTHTGTLWSSTGSKLATVTFSGESATGWQQAMFDRQVTVTAGTTYVASYFAPQGNYAYDSTYFAATGAGTAPIRALATGVDGGNGVYRYGSTSGFPSSATNGANYAVDVVFTTTAPPPDTTKPTVTTSTPAANSTVTGTAATISATFSEPVTAASIAVTQVGGGSVAGTTSYDSDNRKATFQPSGSGLVAGASYQVTVSGATDEAGNVMTSVSWQFTLAQPTCPCTALSGSGTPSTTSASDSNAVTLGVRFTPDHNGTINAIRFYKGPGNTGTHVGRLWSASGQALASATFSNESATGWQRVVLPGGGVPVTAGTTYVASYYAPNGGYAVTPQFFTAAGLDVSPLHLPAHSASAPQGLYRYGSNGFPTDSGNGSNYWVDVEFSYSSAGDTTPPAATLTPANGATGVTPSSSITAAFDEATDGTSGTFTVTRSDGTAVTGTKTWDSAEEVWTFKPAVDLTAGATYTASVSGVRDLAGNTMPSAKTSTFTVAVPACPCTMFGTSPAPSGTSDSNSVEVGVKFRTDVNGSITGLRFYKAPGNTGTHVGTLWTSTGTELASVTFQNETASGWQEAQLATPVPVTAGTTYVASYHADNGGYAFTSGYFTGQGSATAPVRGLANGVDGGNAVYRYGSRAFPDSSGNGSNYWVDVTFTHP